MEPLDTRLLIVTGKGGVGRSAAAAAFAIAAARRSKRVLAIAMTDAAGLAVHLGRPTLKYRPTQIAPNLSAMSIDRARALDEYLKLQLGIGGRAPLLPISRGLEAMAETVPGIRDVITMGKVLFEVQSNEWDLVVADGPATGQIMSYLQAPRTVAGLIPGGRARRQADTMTETLAAADTALAMVTLAEELPVTETLEALSELAKENPIQLAGIWANRLIEPLGVSETSLEQVTSVAARNAGLLHRGLYENQRRWRKYLPEHHRLPFLFGVHDPSRVASLLADEIVA
ncbi:MAG: hypothetical protein HKO03_09855 [Acidimicrobiia bacterium]|nr:hypothetical protein [Acidimicrobiia bacterium]NND13330.1 hypothetical protein [Acidimicrobiia bacterium]